MSRAQAEQYAANRDLWLCLARALAPPGGDAAFHRAFTVDLAYDLSAISEEIGLNIVAEIDAFADAAGKLADVIEIQRVYAALFVTPPVPVFMNTGIYLDSALLGPSELDLNAWYARHGFERHAEFRDLNDHAAVQFEFLGLLFEKAADRASARENMEAIAYATEAQRFMASFPRRWITAFLRALEKACEERGHNSAYAHLARIAWLAIEAGLPAETADLKVEAKAAFPAGSSHGLGPLTAEDLAEIAVRLEAAGLSYAHVKSLPEWQDDAYARRRREIIDSFIGSGTA